jgi:hypothetical protein
MELAEAEAKSLVLLHAQLLIAKEKNQMIHERVVQVLELPIAERLRQIDAKDLRANAWRHFAYFYAPIVHPFFHR